MNKYGMRIAACALAGTFALSGYQMTLEARMNRLSDVPAAGIAVVLDEGSTIQDLQVEVVQNIAYLESVSGIHPNILNASEKVALADSTAANAKLVNAPVNKVAVESETVDSTEQTQTLTEEGNIHSTQEDQEDEGRSEQSQSTETIEENKDTETSQSSESESLETDGSEDTEISQEEELRTSAGFSATEIYKGDKAEESAEEETSEETTEDTEDTQDFSGLVIARVNNYVNVRSMPSEEGEIVGKLYDKSVGEFIEEEDGWYKITSGNCTGYVKGEYCVVGEEAEKLAKEVGTTYAIVNTTTLKVREEASTESSVLGLVPIEEELIVVEELDGWVKIAIEEGDGYVSREFVNLRTDFVHAESKEEEEARLAKEAKAREEARAAAAAAEAARSKAKSEKSANNQAAAAAAQSIAASSQGSEIGKAVIDYATQFVGNPYVYGGSSLTNGTDCSGFVMSVYSNFGVSLPHSSSALRSMGYDVGGLANAQPGDIVCYSGHVGLYVGNGQIVHASTSRTGIIVSSATYRNILSVRRIF